jgi:methylthioribose-1-phosphate isomerase
MEKNGWPGLPFLIQPHNVVHYEDGEVFVLDRRLYPFDRSFVRCKDFEETAKAIEDMVTQSEGPGYTAGYAMVQAAHWAANLKSDARYELLRRAAHRLVDTRPTNNHIRLMVQRMLRRATEALDQGENPEAALLVAMDQEWKKRHDRAMALGRYASAVLQDGDTILNHCWAESGIVYTAYVALQLGMRLEAYCTETRPYLQGARLTADALSEMGIPTTVVTDGMPAHLMYRGRISKFMTGADRVTMDGHVVNKIGTMPLALASHHFQVPYFAFCYGPDPEAASADNVEIEERNPDEVLRCLGTRTATLRARGSYPAFDVTPPEFVSGVITDRGVFSPYALAAYFEGSGA